MKILVVHHSYAEKSHSGEDVVLKKQISFLKSKGHEIVYVNENSDDYFKSWYRFLTTFIKWPINLGRSIEKVISVEKPDVIFIHNLFPTFSTRWIRKNQVPILMWLHNYRNFCIASTFIRNNESCQICIKKPSLRSVYYRCSNGSLFRSIAMHLRLFLNLNLGEYNPKIHFILLSEKSKQLLLQTKIFNAKFSIIPNFIQRQDESLYLKKPAFTRWIFVGRLSQEKGVLPLLKLFPANFELDIYGDGPLLSRVKSEVSKRPNINYKGTFENTDISRILKNYTGAFIPSIWTEGLPTTFMEYCINGIPTITWKQNSSANYVSRYRTGVVVEGVSEKELANAITQILDRHSYFSENAVSLAQKEFSEEIWYQRLMEVLNIEIGRI